MKKIRIGNDLTLRVTVTRLGSEESLEDKQLRLLVRSALETRQLSFTREGSVLTAFWAGSEQAKTGTYTVTLIADYGESSRNTVDTCGAFALVARSGSEDGDALTGAQTIDLDIDVSVPANGLSAYELALRGGYEGTEEEWLDSLKAAPDGKIEELEEQVKAGTQAAEAAQSAANQAKSAANDAYNKASDNETAISEEQTARKTADEELTTKVNAATQAVSTLSSEKTFTAADGTECTATVYLGGLIHDLGTISSDNAEAYAAASDVAGDPACALIVWRNPGTQTTGGTAGRIVNAPTGWNTRTMQLMARGDTWMIREVDTNTTGGTAGDWKAAMPVTLSYNSSTKKLALLDAFRHETGSVTLS